MKNGESTINSLSEQLCKKYPEIKVINPIQVPFPYTHVPIQKSGNRKYFFDNILDCNAIIIILGSHIGIGTTLEIGYAIGLGKRIIFTDFPPNHNQEWDEMWALLEDGTASLLNWNLQTISYAWYKDHNNGEVSKPLMEIEN